MLPVRENREFHHETFPSSILRSQFGWNRPWQVNFVGQTAVESLRAAFLFQELKEYNIVPHWIHGTLWNFNFWQMQGDLRSIHLSLGMMTMALKTYFVSVIFHSCPNFIVLTIRDGNLEPAGAWSSSCASANSSVVFFRQQQFQSLKRCSAHLCAAGKMSKYVKICQEHMPRYATKKQSRLEYGKPLHRERRTCYNMLMQSLQQVKYVCLDLFHAERPFSLEVRLLLPPAAFVRSQSNVLSQHEHFLVNCGLYLNQAAVLMA